MLARLGITQFCSVSKPEKVDCSKIDLCSRYLEAFTLVLELGDDRLVAWLTSQLQPHTILGAHPPLLSQHILLALLQQLGHDLKEVSHDSKIHRRHTTVLF